jgi:hypothetical protein
VSARALAWYQSSLTGGIAFGAWMWGRTTADYGLQAALIASAVAVLLVPLLGLLMPLPNVSAEGSEVVDIGNELDVALAITGRSGPIIVELDYRVAPENARAYYDAMLKLQHARMRNGAFEWSISRDLSDPALWTERFELPTWQDYLRHRSRFTLADQALQQEVSAFNMLEAGAQIRRRLERPFGSVRWQADSPDPYLQLTPVGGSDSIPLVSP